MIKMVNNLYTIISFVRCGISSFSLSLLVADVGYVYIGGRCGIYVGDG